MRIIKVALSASLLMAGNLYCCEKEPQLPADSIHQGAESAHLAAECLRQEKELTDNLKKLVQNSPQVTIPKKFCMDYKTKYTCKKVENNYVFELNIPLVIEDDLKKKRDFILSYSVIKDELNSNNEYLIAKIINPVSAVIFGVNSIERTSDDQPLLKNLLVDVAKDEKLGNFELRMIPYKMSHQQYGAIGKFLNDQAFKEFGRGIAKNYRSFNIHLGGVISFSDLPEGADSKWFSKKIKYFMKKNKTYREPRFEELCSNGLTLGG